MGDHEQLLEEARAETGLRDFGHESFLEGLEILVRSLHEEARLNAMGERMLGQRIVGHLKQRLQVEDWYRRSWRSISNRRSFRPWRRFRPISRGCSMRISRRRIFQRMAP